jgi:hypothetical protein
MKLQKLVKILNQKRRPKMKKTPEQKAFREYGKALGRLEEFRRNHQDQFCVQSQIMRHFWREAHVCCGQKEITNKHVKLIRDAWQKRAACKAWNPPDGRDCPNCFYSSNRRCKLPCSQCWGHCLWEPRKEGK